MFTASTFFLSYITGKRIISPEGKTLGTLKDLIADPVFARPKIIAAVISSKTGEKTIDFSCIKMANVKDKHLLICSEVKPVIIEGDNVFYLNRQVLDKQIVDMNKKRLVSVNDIKLAILPAGTFVVAVDAGLEGRLRRLGIAKPVKNLLKLFDVSVPRYMVLWDDVETVNFGEAGTGLSKSVLKLRSLHPSDMADIIEDMGHAAQVDVFSAMDTERAADVLEELESDTRESLLESIPAEKAADVLEVMPADEVADILDEIGKDRSEALLQEMDSETSDEVRELMEYKDYEVGSLMTTEYICFRDNEKVEDALRTLRRIKPESDTIYYLYVVSEIGELKATVSLRDIVVSDIETNLADIMNKDVIYVYDTDRIESLVDMMNKYNLLAVPVVDSDKILLGVVIINDVMFNLLRSRRKKQ